MKYQFKKLAQIGILVFYSLYTSTPIPYITAIIISNWTAKGQLYATIISIVSILTSMIILKSWMTQLVIIALCVCLKIIPSQDESWNSIKIVFPFYIFALGMITMTTKSIFRNFNLIIFYIVLAATYWRVPTWLIIATQLISYVQSLYLFCADYCSIKQLWIWNLQLFLDNNPWWHYVGYVGVIITCNLLLRNNIEDNISVMSNNSQDDDEPMIQLHQIKNQRQKSQKVEQHLQNPKQQQCQNEKKLIIDNKREKQQQPIKKEPQSELKDPQSELKINPTKQNQGKQRSLLEVNQQSLSARVQKSVVSLYTRSVHSNNPLTNSQFTHSNQAEILNLFLLLPFILYSLKILQVPIYIYFIALHYSKVHPIIYFCMLLSIFTITFRNYSQQNGLQNFILRVCMVLMVDKNFQIAINIADAIRLVWLRGSFVIVLAILFWFGLRTVNIFHLIFIIIILLFITKGAEKDRVSFRHRNWKYLVNIFNVFIVLRYIYQLVGYNKFFVNYQKYYVSEILALIGISHNYLISMNIDYFNLVPLLISAIIAIQYWTYSSKIYKRPSIEGSQSSSPYQILFSLNYRKMIEKLLNFLSLIFYKLIPWASYIVIIITLLLIDFSLSSGLLFIWIVGLLGFQICYRNSYTMLEKGWLIFSRLAALQILLRYIFQFFKFEIIFAVMDKLPWFKMLIKYQQLLGLIIRQSSNVYFKAITKFQLMIALDFGMIFVAFLVTEYLNIIIKYKQLIKRQLHQQNLQQILLDHEHQNQQKKRIKQIYQNYINFKITTWFIEHNLQKLLNFLSFSYLKLYLPIIGIYSCYQFSIMMFMYLFIILLFYLHQNTKYYTIYIGSGLAKKIRLLSKDWSLKPVRRQAQQLQQSLIQNQIQMNSTELNSHESIQKWIVILSIIGVLLTYSSRILFTPQINDFSSSETILKLDWFLFINGTSSRCSYCMIIFLLILILIIIQGKSYLYMSKQELKQQILKLEQANTDETICNYIQMQISLLFGFNKLIQRAFVTILVFASIVQDQNPFAIIYLLCAWLLNSVGNASTLFLSRVLCILVILEYLLRLLDFSNSKIYRNIPNQFSQFHKNSLLDSLPKEWSQYLSYGDSKSQVGILMMTFCLLVLYQIYFIVSSKNWLRVLKYLCEQLTLSKIQKRLYQYFSQVYHYILIYTPLCITVLCIILYFMDYTVTNLFLSLLSLVFLFKSFLVENYVQSRPFWKSYFIVLQLFIITFMVVYCVLSIPMYKKYCNEIFCSKQQFRTKVTKAILLFILQIGVDMMKSHLFISEMNNLKKTIQQNSSYSRLAISYKLNDRKILKKFDNLSKRKILQKDIDNVQDYFKELKKNPTLSFQNKKQIIDNKQSWLDTILELLPSLVDPILLMSLQRAKQYIADENYLWKAQKQLSTFQLYRINESYLQQFQQYDSRNQQLLQKIHNIRKMHFSQKNQYERISHKSYIDQKLPMESEQLCRQIVDSKIRQSQAGENIQELKNVQEAQKKNLLYLLLFESVISNWHYLTYCLMVLEHLRNMGILTIIFPFLAFLVGIPQTFQASKNIWKLSFLALMVPISLKFILGIGLIKLQPNTISLLIGDNINSILLQYLLILSILIQCLILKIVGLYDASAPQIQCMRMALIRNIINRPQQNSQQLKKLQTLLIQSDEMSTNPIEYIFHHSQNKSGYDYSTMLVTIQLIILIYIFIFYDRIILRKDLSFYSMIQYNQFTSGMVLMVIIHLILILLQRFINIADLRNISKKWELTLIFKYTLLVIVVIVVHCSILFIFPLLSGRYYTSIYIQFFYLLFALYFLISSLQIKYGIDQLSRGFMERYTWYNGFIYIFFRAIPFLFEFKIFSDWTVTKTSLRLFDWLKFQQIFGKVYVAKCNSLFLRGKVLGSKIEWWKKLLMGYPLLISIILLLFGPLVLFSGLNPLTKINGVSGGYLELVLKINSTNQYILYTNSHITDIQYYDDKMNLDNETQQIIELYDIQSDNIQIVNLEEYSDQYWQISQGSYQKLIAEPIYSIYQLSIRMKFHRNKTGTTPIYITNTYKIPNQQIQQFKNLLKGCTINNPNNKMTINKFIDNFIRLDNNNGLHILNDQQQRTKITFYAQYSQKSNKKYWVIQHGIQLKIASDKYSQAIFGYSVMSFYISIILVIANYFRFLFQGSAHTIIMSDIPIADPILRLCQGVYQARIDNDLIRQQKLFWLIIDLVRSPDSIKLLTGDYLDSRQQTIKKNV